MPFEIGKGYIEEKEEEKPWWQRLLTLTPTRETQEAFEEWRKDPIRPTLEMLTRPLDWPGRIFGKAIERYRAGEVTTPEDIMRVTGQTFLPQRYGPPEVSYFEQVKKAVEPEAGLPPADVRKSWKTLLGMATGPLAPVAAPVGYLLSSPEEREATRATLWRAAASTVGILAQAAADPAILASLPLGIGELPNALIARRSAPAAVRAATRGAVEAGEMSATVERTVHREFVRAMDAALESGALGEGAWGLHAGTPETVRLWQILGENVATKAGVADQVASRFGVRISSAMKQAIAPQLRILAKPTRGIQMAPMRPTVTVVEAAAERPVSRTTIFWEKYVKPQTDRLNRMRSIAQRRAGPPPAPGEVAPTAMRYADTLRHGVEDQLVRAQWGLWKIRNWPRVAVGEAIVPVTGREVFMAEMMRPVVEAAAAPVAEAPAAPIAERPWTVETDLFGQKKTVPKDIPLGVQRGMDYAAEPIVPAGQERIFAEEVPSEPALTVPGAQAPEVVPEAPEVPTVPEEAALTQVQLRAQLVGEQEWMLGQRWTGLVELSPIARSAAAGKAEQITALIARIDAGETVRPDEVTPLLTRVAPEKVTAKPTPTAKGIAEARAEAAKVDEADVAVKATGARTTRRSILSQLNEYKKHFDQRVRYLSGALKVRGITGKGTIRAEHAEARDWLKSINRVLHKYQPKPPTPKVDPRETQILRGVEKGAALPPGWSIQDAYAWALKRNMDPDQAVQARKPGAADMGKLSGRQYEHLQQIIEESEEYATLYERQLEGAAEEIFGTEEELIRSDITHGIEQEVEMLEAELESAVALIRESIGADPEVPADVVEDLVADTGSDYITRIRAMWQEYEEVNAEAAQELAEVPEGLARYRDERAKMTQEERDRADLGTNIYWNEEGSTLVRQLLSAFGVPTEAISGTASDRAAWLEGFAVPTAEVIAEVPVVEEIIEAADVRVTKIRDRIQAAGVTVTPDIDEGLRQIAARSAQAEVNRLERRLSEIDKADWPLLWTARYRREAVKAEELKARRTVADRATDIWHTLKSYGNQFTGVRPVEQHFGRNIMRRIEDLRIRNVQQMDRLVRPYNDQERRAMYIITNAGNPKIIQPWKDMPAGVQIALPENERLRLLASLAGHKLPQPVDYYLDPVGNVVPDRLPAKVKSMWVDMPRMLQLFEGLHAEIKPVFDELMALKGRSETFGKISDYLPQGAYGDKELDSVVSAFPAEMQELAKATLKQSFSHQREYQTVMDKFMGGIFAEAGFAEKAPEQLRLLAEQIDQPRLFDDKGNLLEEYDHLLPMLDPMLQHQGWLAQAYHVLMEKGVYDYIRRFVPTMKEIAAEYGDGAIQQMQEVGFRPFSQMAAEPKVPAEGLEEYLLSPEQQRVLEGLYQNGSLMRQHASLDVFRSYLAPIQLPLLMTKVFAMAQTLEQTVNLAWSGVTNPITVTRAIAQATRVFALGALEDYAIVPPRTLAEKLRVRSAQIFETMAQRIAGEPDTAKQYLKEFYQTRIATGHHTPAQKAGLKTDIKDYLKRIGIPVDEIDSAADLAATIMFFYDDIGRGAQYIGRRMMGDTVDEARLITAENAVEYGAELAAPIDTFLRTFLLFYKHDRQRVQQLLRLAAQKPFWPVLAAETSRRYKEMMGYDPVYQYVLDHGHPSWMGPEWAAWPWGLFPLSLFDAKPDDDGMLVAVNGYYVARLRIRLPGFEDIGAAWAMFKDPVGTARYRLMPPMEALAGAMRKPAGTRWDEFVKGLPVVSYGARALEQTPPGQRLAKVPGIGRLAEPLGAYTPTEEVVEQRLTPDRFEAPDWLKDLQHPTWRKPEGKRVIRAARKLGIPLKDAWRRYETEAMKLSQVKVALRAWGIASYVEPVKRAISTEWSPDTGSTPRMSVRELEALLAMMERDGRGGSSYFITTKELREQIRRQSIAEKKRAAK